MQQYAATLDVTEETGSQTRAFVRTLDQAGNVGQNELFFAGTDHAEVWVQRRKGIVGDFRPGPRHARQKGRFSGVRQSDQARVGDQLEAEPHPEFLARLTGVRATRRPIGRGFEGGVAQSPATAAGKQGLLADLSQVGEQEVAVVIEDLRPGRNLDHQGFAAGAGPVPTHTVGTAPRLEMLTVAEVDQGVEPLNGLHHHIAAFATVAAVRATEFHILLTAERAGAVSAIAGLNVDLGLVEKFHDRLGVSLDPSQENRSSAEFPPLQKTRGPKEDGPKENGGAIQRSPVRDFEPCRLGRVRRWRAYSAASGKGSTET